MRTEVSNQFLFPPYINFTLYPSHPIIHNALKDNKEDSLLSNGIVWKVVFFLSTPFESYPLPFTQPIRGLTLKKWK